MTREEQIKLVAFETSSNDYPISEYEGFVRGAKWADEHPQNQQLSAADRGIIMKVFGCKNNMSYGGGLILVAANTIEEAFLTAAMDDKLDYLFDWYDDNYEWSTPDGNIDHCSSDTYPLSGWFEVEHLSTDLTKPTVIVEDHYSE